MNTTRTKNKSNKDNQETDKKPTEAADTRYLRKTTGLTLRERRRSAEIKMKITQITQGKKTY